MAARPQAARKTESTKTETVPTQITSRLEDQLVALKSREYKERVVFYQFQQVLLRSRAEVMEKVTRPEEERAINHPGSAL